MKKLKGFTLVELVITIAIVIILSVISVPIYRGYIDKAKLSEAYALLGTLLSASKAYYSEYGNFPLYHGAGNGWTSSDPVLGVDARSNKYFTFFDDTCEEDPAAAKHFFHVLLRVEPGLLPGGDNMLILEYNVTRGSVIHGYPSTSYNSIK